MIARILAIAGNTYREAVRARALHALFAAALLVTGYSLVLASLSLNQDARVIADVGSAAASLFGLLLAVVLAASALQREMEHKTLYPLLSRALQRHEYMLGKFAGIWALLAAFLLTNAALTLSLLSLRSGAALWRALLPFLLWLGCAAAVAARRAWRSFALLPAAPLALLAAALLCEPLDGERQLVLWQLCLSLAECAIVLAMTLLFSAFSSPFLTATSALGLILVGRSAETLAHLPRALLGPALSTLGAMVARIVPNLQLFVPERPLLLGRTATAPAAYVLRCTGLSLAYCAAMLTLAALLFARRDLD